MSTGIVARIYVPTQPAISSVRGTIVDTVVVVQLECTKLTIWIFSNPTQHRNTIQVGTTIAPYTGVLTDFDNDRSDTRHEYVIELQTKGRGNKKRFIDAEEWGTVARFVNHSCGTNTRFMEKPHNREVPIIVTSLKAITTGEEITADHAKTWFTHACKTQSCRQKLSETAPNRQETTE
ncbi:hypothetical protein PHPALM_30240 [Phytophthora palmivora]|uniref:SET domain-containing protein n=1 Tax=Phytophthora palmivora TaxID=4796 RepID=A0A2P4X5L9_9STRA|nr:hypothetical protein PHPALM_30240 [Phytophthora palmivora]